MSRSTKNVSILVADDHPVVREGLALIFERTDGFECVGQASCVEDAIDAWAELKPDVGVFDLRMPDGDAVGAITRIRKTDPNARILVVSSFDGEEEVYRVMKAGARGYLLKDTEPRLIIDAIRAIHTGQRHLPSVLANKLAERITTSDLSPRETEILALASKGNSNAMIARDLGVSESTVKFHLNNTYSKLDVSSRTAAISIAVKRGIIVLD
ncbi:MAG: response regulator transcription factor [Pseudomonadota bacterium]